MEGAALKPPVFTEWCTCGCRAVDHSLMWWLGNMVRLPDQHIVGPCGKCENCHSFSYDGPPHESRLISWRDYQNAPTTEEAEEVRQAATKLTPTSAKVHDRVLSISEIIARVDAQLHPRIGVDFGVVDVSRRLRVSNVKVHDHVLSNEEIAQRVADLVLDCLENNTRATAD